MERINFYIKKIGSLKFAIWILVSFIVLLMAGTVIEAKFGPIVAKYYVYDSAVFYFIVLAIILSLFFSMLERPFNKIYYGFYMIHTGLIILACGSLISKISGFEGKVNLYPNENTNILELDRYEVQVHQKDKNTIVYNLPSVIGPTNLNMALGYISLNEYLPFSKEVIIKKERLNNELIDLEVYNDSLYQKVTLSNDKSSQYFKEQVKLGPLKVQLINQDISLCIGKGPYILIDRDQNKCVALKNKEIRFIKDRKLLSVNTKKAKMTFAPNFSSYPLTETGAEILESPFQLYSTQSLKEKYTLWLSMNSSYFYHKNKLVIKSDKNIELPWMNFKLNLERMNNKTLALGFKENEVKNKFRPAIRLNFKNKNYWVSEQNSASIENAGKHFLIQLKSQKKSLPFQLSLKKFILDKDFGTGRDAFYESNVNFFNGKENKQSSISLNNPLKNQNFTLYQDSYKKLKTGQFLSVLRVNVDPGRYLKYFGWIIALAGMLIHFKLRRIKI